MSRPPLCILQVNTFNRWGGAESVTRNLLEAYRRRGHDAYLAVGRNVGGDPDVLPISHDAGRGPWHRLWRGVEYRLRWLDKYAHGASSGQGKSGLRSLLGSLADPGRIADALQGRESFRFPGTYGLLDLAPRPPDIVQAHNLHGGYFDLRALPWLSRRTPLVLTLHDSWLLSGHCSQSFDCERWQSGCGQCPDLSIYPPIWRDGTAGNWERKRSIYARSRLFVAAPSAWLLKRVKQSILAPALVESRVIAHGVDLEVLQPADRDFVREELGIPTASRVLLFVASGIRENPFKDFRMLRSVVARVGEQLGDTDVMLIALGETHPPERIGRARVRFVPFEPDPARVARYYQAADLYLHATRADTFPMAVLEALACGTPVVATAVGGVPEQVKSLDIAGATDQYTKHEAFEATGVLVAPGDAHGMAQSAVTLLSQPERLRQLAVNAATDARRRFDVRRQGDTYLEWYRSILERTLPSDRADPRHECT